MAVKYLVSGKAGDRLPYTKADGTADHRLMGAAWAALHGGYRGNKYEGPAKDAAIKKLTALYKAEKMDTPQESFFVPAASESLIYEADGITPRAESYDAVRQRVQSAIDHAIRDGQDMDLDGDDDSGMGGCCCDYAWVADLFPTTVVYSMNGDYFQCEYHDDGEIVTLGTPVAVAIAYVEVPDDPGTEDDEAEPDDAQEAHRSLCAEVSQFKEAAYDATTGTLSLTVIKPGLNKSKQRFYPAEVLKRDYKIFEGAKMFADHQSDKESRERPEGSVHNWVASVNKVWAESDGTVKANAVVIDPPFKAKLEELGKQNLLHEMGVSIRAIGEAVAGKIGDVKTNIVESLLRARSVDFVTYAGAGGMVEAIEAETFENDLDLVSEADLRQRRPDLVELIERSTGNSNPEGDLMKTLEQELKEAQAKLVEAEAANKKLKETSSTLAEQVTTLTTKIAESEQATKRATAQGELVKLMIEAKLPEIARPRVIAKFTEATSTEGMKEAIAEELGYIKSFGGSSKVLHMGEKHNGSADNTDKDVTVALKESFMAAGMDEKQAELAAAGRR